MFDQNRRKSNYSINSCCYDHSIDNYTNDHHYYNNNNHNDDNHNDACWLSGWVSRMSWY